MTAFNKRDAAAVAAFSTDNFMRAHWLRRFIEYTTTH